MDQRNPLGLPELPGKFASSVKIGPKGQVVIPKPARDMFGWEPGTTVLLLADVEHGIAIVPHAELDKMMAGTMDALPGTPPSPDGTAAEEEPR